MIKSAFTALAAVIMVMLIMASARNAFGQTYGAEIPWTSMNFLGTTGVIIPNGKLCSYINGTTTKQDTYTTSDISGTGVKNANPIIMNSQGRPTTNGIYMIAAKYTFVLKTAGTDSTCSTGATVWTANDIFDIGQLLAAGLVSFTSINNRQFCATGASFGAKFTAAVALLPSTGGTIDCSGLQGVQTTNDVFSGVVKPIRLLWPSTAVTSSVSITVPANVVVEFSRAGSLSIASATTATFLSTPVAGDYPIFTGTGNAALKGPGPVHLAWWLTAGDGQSTPFSSADGTGGLVPALNAVLNNWPQRIIAPCGQINITVTPNWHWDQVGSNSWFPDLIGCGVSPTEFLLQGGASGLALDTTGRGNGQWIEGLIQDVWFENKAAVGTTVCLSVNNTQTFRLNRVRTSGCHIGFKSVYSWNWSIMGRSEFRQGDIGIYLQDNNNAVSIFDADVSNNTVAGIDIRSDGTGTYAGGDINITNVLAQGDPTAVFIGTGNHINVTNLYGEGANLNYVYQVGVDSSGNTGTPLGVYIKGTFFSNNGGTPALGCIQSVQDFRFEGRDTNNIGWAYGCGGAPGTISNTVFEDWNNLALPNRPINTVPGTGKARVNAVGVSSPANLIPNGGNQFPNTAYWESDTTTVGFSVVDGATTGGLGTNSKVMLLTIPAGTTLAVHFAQLPVFLSEFKGAPLWLSVHAKLGAGLSTSNLTLESNGGGIIGTTGNLTTSWTTTSTAGTVNNNALIKINFTVTDNSVDRYIYIEDLRLMPRLAAMGNMVATSVSDQLAGMSVQVAATSANGAVYMTATPIDSGTSLSARYNVIITPENAIATDTRCWANKLAGGANAGKFHVVCNVSVAIADVTIIPRVGFGP